MSDDLAILIYLRQNNKMFTYLLDLPTTIAQNAKKQVDFMVLTKRTIVLPLFQTGA